MTSRRFDTLGTARELEATGIERGQAEAIARAIGRDGERLATRDDIERLDAARKSDTERLEARTASKEDVARLESRSASKEDLRELESRTASKEDIARLENRSASKEDLQRHEATTKAEFKRMEALIATKVDRGELYRALWIQGAGIVGILAAMNFWP